MFTAPKQLKQIREAMGLTGQQVATALHIDKSNYFQFESYRWRPKLTRYRQIAEYFGYDVDIILVPRKRAEPK
jgi:transcriptional regulator with XRE-family HTH domain